MATSGTFTTYLSGDLYLRMNWNTVSQDIANNSSVINVDLILGAGSSISASGTRNAQITINGNSRPFSFTIGSFTGAWSTTLGSHFVTVPHNADGTKTAAISAWADVNLTWSGNYVGRGSISGSATPNAIPRASTLSAYPTSIPAGSAFTATINRASTSFTHDVKFSFGSSFTTTLTGQTTSTSYVIPLGWLVGIPAATSGTMNVLVTTKNGAAVVGTKSYTVTLTAPASVVPTFASLDTTRVDGPVPAAWGIYVQNKSQLTLNINAPSGIYGSTITSYRLIGSGADKLSQSGTFTLPYAGEMFFTGVVTDSRGRTFSRDISITVVPYAPPRITKIEVDRATSGGVVDSEGTYIRALVDDEVDSVAGKNTVITRKIEHKLSGTGVWTDDGAYSDNVASTKGAGGFSTNSVYDVRATVTDAFTTVTASTEVATAFVTMDFLGDGTGIAFGKVSSLANTFETALHLKAIAGVSYIPQAIPSSANLDTYTTPGTWLVASNAVAATVSNIPTVNAGALEVFGTVGTPLVACIQYFHEYDTGATGITWRRRWYNGTWTAWVRHAGEGVFSYGSGANGAWRRNNQNGLQECWIYIDLTAQAINTAYGALWQGTWRWNFPRAFNNAGNVYPLPAVTCSRFLWGTGASWGTVSTITGTYSDLRGVDAFSRAAGAVNIAAYAIGYTTS